MYSRYMTWRWRFNDEKRARYLDTSHYTRPGCSETAQTRARPCLGFGTKSISRDLVPIDPGPGDRQSTSKTISPNDRAVSVGVPAFVFEIADVRKAGQRTHDLNSLSPNCWFVSASLSWYSASSLAIPLTIFPARPDSAGGRGRSKDWVVDSWTCRFKGDVIKVLGQDLRVLKREMTHVPGLEIMHVDEYLAVQLVRFRIDRPDRAPSPRPRARAGHSLS
jgi:hypothetical protein